MTDLLTKRALIAYRDAQDMQTEYSRFIDLEREFYRVQEECWMYENVTIEYGENEDRPSEDEDLSLIPDETRIRFENLALAYLSHPLLLERFTRVHEGETDEETLRLYALLQNLQETQQETSRNS